MKAYTEYLIRSEHNWHRIIIAHIDGQTFASGFEVKNYLINECGFTETESQLYINSLPHGRVGIEI